MNVQEAVEFIVLVGEADLEEAAWLLLARKPWAITPELLYATKTMIADMVHERMQLSLAKVFLPQVSQEFALA